jgi:putative cell wall-binding protein
MPRRRPTAIALVTVLALSAGVTACGKQDPGVSGGPQIGKKGNDSAAARSLGFPAFATKNTTRVGGADPTADAAGVAQAVFTGQSTATRPFTVMLVNKDSWQAGIAAAVLMAPPLRAPVLLTNGGDLPDASKAALGSLAPTGSRELGGGQVIRIGDAAKPGGLKVLEIKGKSTDVAAPPAKKDKNGKPKDVKKPNATNDPYALAAAIADLRANVAGRQADRVIVTSGEQSGYAMPAAGWAAKGGDPVLFVTRNGIPTATRRALTTASQPSIYLLGPTTVVSAKVEADLKKLGRVHRIGGSDPVRNAIAFARFIDGRFGWGVVDPGHGLVFANAGAPLDAVAAAPLSAAGTYGPLLLTSGSQLPASLVQYLLDIQPGYDKDPVRGVYNHGWLIGDDKAITIADQSRIDALLEIVPVTAATPAPTKTTAAKTPAKPPAKTRPATTPAKTTTTPAKTTN